MLQEWLVLPTVGALIGYITNVVAIRMLFRPRRARRIPGTPWVIQGLVPMRQQDLARAIGETVERDLLPIDSLVTKINIAAYKHDVVRTIVQHVDKRIRGTLPRWIPQTLQDGIVSFLSDLTQQEAGKMLDSVNESLQEKLRSDLHLGALVEEKILDLDLDALEQLVTRISHKELRHIEVLGAVLGFLIGVGQVGLIAIMR